MHQNAATRIRTQLPRRMLLAISVRSFLFDQSYRGYATCMQSEVCGLVGILGFGVDGQGIAEWLAKQPKIDRILVFDDKAKSNGAMEQWSNVTMGLSIDGIDLLFRSPGFPLTHPLI